MDQCRAVNAMQRKEVRVSMSIFTWVLDNSSQNAFCLWKELMPESKMQFQEFKQQVVVALTSPYKTYRERKRSIMLVDCSITQCSIGMQHAQMEEAIGFDAFDHFLIMNKKNKQLQCFLCRILIGPNRKDENGKPMAILRRYYGCSKSGKGFHINCYIAFHFHNAMKKIMLFSTEFWRHWTMKLI